MGNIISIIPKEKSSTACEIYNRFFPLLGESNDSKPINEAFVQSCQDGSMEKTTTEHLKYIASDYDQVLSRLEFTYLEEIGDETPEDETRNKEKTLKLCDEAAKWHPSCICVRPRWLPLVADRLKNNAVKIVTVVGFPNKKNGDIGLATTDQKIRETIEAAKKGAEEIDMVINLPALKAGLTSTVKNDIEAVVKAANGRPVKVILETGLLSGKEIAAGCRASEEAGGKFVKTSTGYGPRGASLKDAEIMMKSCGLGIKLSGGIKTLSQCKEFINLIGKDRAVRFGSSQGEKIAEEEFSEALPLDTKLREPVNVHMKRKFEKAFDEAKQLKTTLLNNITEANNKGFCVAYVSISVRTNEMVTKEENIKLRQSIIDNCKKNHIAYVDPFEVEKLKFMKDTALDPALKEKLLMGLVGGVWPAIIPACNIVVHGPNWKYSEGAKTEHLLANWLSIPVGEDQDLIVLKNNICGPIAMKNKYLPKVSSDYLNLVARSIPA